VEAQARSGPGLVPAWPRFLRVGSCLGRAKFVVLRADPLSPAQMARCIDTFMDYSFASKLQCDLIDTVAHRAKVARGGYLDSSALIPATTYTIQVETFNNAFRLFQLKGHDIIVIG
jgi:hypothetical protein